MNCLIETIMAEIKEPTSRYTGLILHQLDSIYPKDERRELVRRAVLSALGNRGLLTEIHSDNGWLRDCGQPWNFQALAHWVRNPHIVGEVEINSKNKGKDQKSLPRNEQYRIVPAVWDSVVDPSKLIQARKLLDENYRKLKVSQWKNHDYILTDLIFCQKGNRLIGKSGTGRSGKKYPYYKHSCRTKCKCGLTKVPAVQVEQHVLRELKRMIKSPKMLEELCVVANEKFMAKQPNFDELIRAENNKILGITRQLDKITDEILMSGSDEEKTMWREKAYRLQKEKQSVEQQIDHLEDRKWSKPQLLDAETIKQALDRLANGIGSLPIAARLRLVRGVLDGVAVKKDHLVFVVPET